MAFDDVMSQLHDMVNPADSYFFTLRDLKKSRALTGTLFNTLFNLTKFISFEMYVSGLCWIADRCSPFTPRHSLARCSFSRRDPFTIKAEREFMGSDWERFAKDEYVRLALEDDGEDGMDDDGDGMGDI